MEETNKILETKERDGKHTFSHCLVTISFSYSYKIEFQPITTHFKGGFHHVGQDENEIRFQ